MSPRTPASIAVGTLVTVALFGLMQSMVSEPEAYPLPPRPALDPFVAVDPMAPLPTLPPRTAPERPEARPRPTDGPVATAINVEGVVGPSEGPLIPPYRPGETTHVVGPTDGRVGRGDGTAVCGEAQPRLLVTPDYPRAQRAAGVEGEVEVAFTVAPDGRVLDARILRASPRGAFEAATLRAVRQWRFEAASADCPRAAEARTETVTFRLDGVED